jgi:putative DNA methylase
MLHCETAISSHPAAKPEGPKPALIPHSLRDAPALIESVFPAQKVSFEAQKERKANLGQTLTGLGSYWKGRKPLILVRTVVLGSLLPQTGDPEKDLEIFEKLMAFDEEGLARRALVQNQLKPKEIALRVTLANPWDFFSHSIKESDPLAEAVKHWTFPLDCHEKKISIRWRRDIDEQDRIEIYRKALNTFPSYEARAAICKRPEELDQHWLYKPIWSDVNRHYGYLGIEAHSHQELIEQLGILRYGHRPKVGDTFCGGGSIPFEAARLGCDVYASDLNPIACMLTWGALNIIGASPKRRAEIEQAQREVAEAVDREITALGIEHDKQGNRAKAYLYCLETRCPETDWRVPMSPSWVISKTRNVVARLIPDPINKRFDIDVITGVSTDEMKAAAKGTVQDGALVYVLDGKTYRTPIKTLRGDYRDAQGDTQNRLRRWKKTDFKPATDDTFQERPYAIQWITKETLHTGRKETFFASVTDEDLQRERRVEVIVQRNLAQWQAEGLAPDMPIEPGDKTDEPIRTRGWTYWHHLFNARQLLLHSRYGKLLSSPELYLVRAKALDWNSRICHWITDWEKTAAVFYSQALNTFNNYGCRAYIADLNARMATGKSCDEIHSKAQISCVTANKVNTDFHGLETSPKF